MIISIHQPNYLPYLGFFDKMSQSDTFVIYDDAQFDKGDFQHRNRIRINHGWKWLTVPVDKKRIPIKDIKIRNGITSKGVNWQEAHTHDIINNYNNTPHYEKYGSTFNDIYLNEYEYLIDINMNIINYLKDAFKIKCEIIMSSELDLKSKSTMRLVEITQILDSETYLSGPNGHDYLDISLFEKSGINVKFQEWKHPVYKQYYTGFVPNVSAIDALFNVGHFPCPV